MTAERTSPRKNPNAKAIQSSAAEQWVLTPKEKESVFEVCKKLGGTPKAEFWLRTATRSELEAALRQMVEGKDFASN